MPDKYVCKIITPFGERLIKAAALEADLLTTLTNTFKKKQTEVPSPTASGSGVQFIDTISQDENGVITAHKRVVTDASTTEKGLMSATDKIKLENVIKNFATNYDNLTFPVAEGTFCEHGGLMYYCSATGGIATSEVWTPAHWTETNVAAHIITEDDVKKVVQNSEWVDISGKIGSVVIPSPSNVQIFWNKTLSLIHIRFYFGYGSAGTGNRIAYRFNNDIPGANETSGTSAMFLLEAPCYVFDYKIGLARIYPYQFSDANLKLTINVSMDNSDRASFSGLIRFNSSYTDALQNYLDSH